MVTIIVSTGNKNQGQTLVETISVPRGNLVPLAAPTPLRTKCSGELGASPWLHPKKNAGYEEEGVPTLRVSYAIRSTFTKHPSLRCAGGKFAIYHG